MATLQFQKLTRQNRKLQQQLKQHLHKISALENQSTIHKQLNRKWNKQKQFLNQQIKQLRRRQEQMKHQKEQTEHRYMNVLRKLENQLEQRKNKYYKLESKIEPLMDHDTVRLKILNQVETVHFMEIEEYERKVSQFKDQILKLKRHNQLLKHQIENNKLEHVDQIRRIKNQAIDKNKNDHLNQLSYEMCMEIQNRLRLNYEQARKEADYYKDKFFSSEKKYQDRVAQLERQLISLRKLVDKH